MSTCQLNTTLTGQSWTWYPEYDPANTGFPRFPGDPMHGYYDFVSALYEGVRHETYGYNACGALASVHVAETGYTDNYDGTVTPTGAGQSSEDSAIFRQGRKAR